MLPEQATSAAENPASYFLFFISGIMTEPIAAVSATPEPEIPPMIMPLIATTCARLPLILPTKARAKLMILLVIPPWLISAPASMNRGTAIKGNESSAVNRRWLKTAMG